VSGSAVAAGRLDEKIEIYAPLGCPRLATRKLQVLEIV
jgi:hypothetical protein